MISLSEALDLAISHHQAGRLAEAANIYAQILQVDPHNAEALHLTGRIEHQKGCFERAAKLFRQAIAAEGTEATFYHSLAETLRTQGNLEPSITAYHAALRLRPGYALAYGNLGAALLAQQDLVAAEAAFRNALRLDPNLNAVQNNLGVLLRELGRWSEARNCFLEALQCKPDFVEAQNNLGNVFRDEGQMAAAIEAYRRALQMNPDYGPAHFNLGNALKRSDRVREALVEFQQAVRIDPADAEARTNLGVVYNELGQVDLAVEECRKAVELRPDFALAHNNLASCLHARGQSEEALAFYRQAAALAPSDALLHANLAHALNYMPQVDPQTIYQEHRRWAQRHADPLTPPALPRAADRAADRRLKIGYVSPYFRQHAISVFTEPILAAHDHQRFEILCYSDVKHPDDATRRFQAAADRWIDTTADSDQQLAQRIAAEGVDILVDLTGHLEGSRLLAFARKPAPIQITYIGYQNTTGMRAMDYRLTDAFADPPGLTDRYHSEQLIRLPGAFFCYQPLSQAPPVNPLPALTAGGITFGSFNKLAKVTGEVLDTWAQVLAAVPGSRLLILADLSAQARQRVQAVMAAHGVDPNCVQLVAKRPRPEYLALHQQVDIALDTFPFNGHTTICEALWMGVPVLMLAGQTYVSRFGGSALQNLGLEGWIAQSRDEYVQTAVEWAGDLQRLQALRAGLRQRMLASPLLDAAGFTRNLEAVYRQLWDNLPSTGPATG